MPIPDKYLMMVATKAMLSSERFHRANEDWGGLEKVYKSWMKWCELYKKADMKETIRIQAGGEGGGTIRRHGAWRCCQG